MADDDLATERARLEAVAWGADSTPMEAARARIALEDLTAGPRPRRPSSAEAHAEREARQIPGSGTTGGHSAPDIPTARAAAVVPVGDARADDRRDDPGPAPVAAAAVDSAPGAAGSGVTRMPPTDSPTGPGDGATAGAGGGAGLQAGWRRRAHDLLWTRRPRVWIALGAAAAVGVAFAAGTVVGTAQPSMPAAPSITPTAGTVTLEQLLDVPQTYADQLPGPVDAPVSLHSTRLIFTNRALDGGDLETPWNVWAGVGTDRSTICLVATADRIESSTACYPREDALHGSVSLSAQSRSGTLTLWLRGGGVQGTVTDTY
ncbi:hypothetical protein [Curtobacterium luteum]|uniref:Uncharacterized protein n=1 Tax=Curtobacterium luteum TaxID=33881 RepID=A0A175RGV7_9MICO|nr:hypothetical protein [Curtobacterium luteum]KTR02905.1 hypothetical protein NS184_14900 [Curtobacterium luteum]